MNDSERSMKYFIVFALGAAVLLPVCGEVFANVSRTAAFVLLVVWAAAAGVKFSSLSLKSAMLGITAYVFSTMVLSVIGYVIIHPAVRSWLERNSDYFELPLTEWAGYWGRAFLLLFASYAVYFVRLGIAKALGKMKSNSENAASAIDNAFDDGDAQ